jgi:hypothetical protein
MSYYRKKPVAIEAFQWFGTINRYSAPSWFLEAMQNNVVYFVDNKLRIDTLEGTYRASIGDFIIQGVKGEIYPCKPDIFKETYEEVSV